MVRTVSLMMPTRGLARLWLGSELVWIELLHPGTARVLNQPVFSDDIRHGDVVRIRPDPGDGDVFVLATNRSRDEEGA